MQNVSIHDRHVSEYPTLNLQEYAAGDTIFSEGNPGKCAFIVQSGIIEITKIGAKGEVVIGYVGAGEIFGEMAPIDNEPRMASAVRSRMRGASSSRKRNFRKNRRVPIPSCETCCMFLSVRYARSHTLVLYRDLS